MEHPGPSRRQLEDVWRKRLVDAIGRYRIAKLEVTKAAAESRKQNLPPPDGNFAYSRALREENGALAEYKRVLFIFNDFLLNGNIPPDA